uniref:Uncharacterized protein n=1 Tax=Nothobranchius furzeri TaxID=105023 RepID=A0A8C6M3H4_NOTFU
LSLGWAASSGAHSWMSHLPCALWDTPLFHLAIPGSHKAITYCLDTNNRSPVDPMQPDMLQQLDKFMKPFILSTKHF